jgi:hypothetical protein
MDDRSDSDIPVLGGTPQYNTWENILKWTKKHAPNTARST